MAAVPVRIGRVMDTILYMEASTRSEAEQMKLAGVSRYARLRKWNVQIVYRTEAMPPVTKILKEFRPIGAIVESSDCSGRLPPRLFGRIPVVYLDPDPTIFGGKVPAVIHTADETAQFALRELLSIGVRRVAYAGTTLRIYWSEARRRAFMAAAENAGVPCDVFTSDRGPNDQIGYERDLSDWIRTLPSGIGLLAANDRIASCVLAACRRLNIGVPSEMVVLGVDNDVNRCENETPQLSSIQLDFEHSGYQAGELLDAILSGRARRNARVTFGPLGVMRRESTRAFPRMNPRITAAMHLIREKACEGLTAREVAKFIGGSRRLAEIRFREATGKSILQEIQAVRLEKVVLLLAHTSKPIGSIAGLCGYRSDIALRTLFSRRMGMSMQAWRKANADPMFRKSN